MIWTKPKQFEHTHVVSTPVINKYGQANLRYLFERPRYMNRIVPSADTDYQTSSDSYVNISQNFRVILDIEQEDTDVMIWYNLATISADNATAYQQNNIIILQDGETWLPIDDDTTRATLNYNRYGASTVSENNFKWLVRGLETGRHYWDFYWKIQTAYPALRLRANMLQVTGAIEI